MVKLSIVIVGWNSKAYLLPCLDSLFRFAPSCAFEVIYVDNASQDGSVQAVREHYPVVRVMENAENLGFARAVNTGLRLAQGEYVLLLNPDTLALEGSFDVLIGCLDEDARVGAASGKCLYPDGSVQWTIGEFPSISSFLVWLCRRHGMLSALAKILRKARDTSRGMEQDYAYGAFCLVRRETIDDVGLMDENMFLYGEEIDWCLRMKRKGWKILYTPEAQIVHHCGGTMARNPKRSHIEWLRSHRYLVRKYRGTAYGVAVDAIMVADIALGLLESTARNLLGRRSTDPAFQSAADCLEVFRGAFLG